MFKAVSGSLHVFDFSTWNACNKTRHVGFLENETRPCQETAVHWSSIKKHMLKTKAERNICPSLVVFYCWWSGICFTEILSADLVITARTYLAWCNKRFRTLKKKKSFNRSIWTYSRLDVKNIWAFDKHQSQNLFARREEIMHRHNCTVRSSIDKRVSCTVCASWPHRLHTHVSAYSMCVSGFIITNMDRWGTLTNL